MVKFSLEDPEKILRVGTKLNVHADDRLFDMDQQIAGASGGDIETLVYSIYFVVLFFYVPHTANQNPKQNIIQTQKTN